MISENKIPPHDLLPPAVIVGLCAHGLSMVRALSGHGFEIFAVELNPTLPGVRTRLARVIMVEENLNTTALVGTLLQLHDQFWSGSQPVLFLTNDNMVRNVGEHWQTLAGKFRLSWAEMRQDVLKLLDKSSLETHCRTVGLNYPHSVVIDSASDLPNRFAEIKFPAIAKPVKPLSRFKAEVVRNTQELLALARNFPNDFPILVQDWIPGDDSHLHFSNAYLAKGRILGRFEGRKLRSSPPARGQGTVVEPFPSEEVYALMMRFFEPLRMSGPAALELKHDMSGDWWVIEPTIGRTEFLVGCCIANGINIPLLEYFHQLGWEKTSAPSADSHVWFNTERDPMGLIMYMLGRTATKHRSLNWCFPYFAKGDFQPSLIALRRDTLLFFQRAVQKTKAYWHSLKKFPNL